MTPEEQRRANQERGVAGLPTGSDEASVAARKAFRHMVAQNEQNAEAAARSGQFATIDDYLQSTGRTGTKEGGGQRLRNLYGQGGLYSEYGGGVDPNHIYDWSSGKKYNIATSDLGNEVWEDISPEEWASHNSAPALSGQTYWQSLAGGHGGGGGGGQSNLSPQPQNPQSPSPVVAPGTQTAAVAPPAYGTSSYDWSGGGGRAGGGSVFGGGGDQQQRKPRQSVSTQSGSYVPGIGGGM